MFKSLLKSSGTLKNLKLYQDGAPDGHSLNCKTFWKKCLWQIPCQFTIEHPRQIQNLPKDTVSLREQLKPTWLIHTTVSPLCLFLATLSCLLPYNSFRICLTLCRIISALGANRKIIKNPRSTVWERISLAWGEKGRNDIGIRRSRPSQRLVIVRNILWCTQTSEHTSALRLSRDYHTYSIPKHNTFGRKR